MPAGATIAYAYDQGGLPVGITDAENYTRSRAYNAVGWQVSAMDDLGRAPPTLQAYAQLRGSPPHTVAGMLATVMMLAAIRWGGLMLPAPLLLVSSIGVPALRYRPLVRK